MGGNGQYLICSWKFVTSRLWLSFSGESLGLSSPCSGSGVLRTKAWRSHHTPVTRRMERYVSMPREEAVEHIPLLFIAFPSAKDPTWEDRFPGGAAGPG